MSAPLSPRTVQAVEDRALYSRAREDLLWWVRLTHPGYKAGWFHRVVCAELQRFSEDVAAGRSPRLMLFAPPRHGKSAITSQRWPGWHLGRYPGHEVVCASYGQSLADKNSRMARSILRGSLANRVFPGVVPRDSKSSKTRAYSPNDIDQVAEWGTGTGGRYKAVGVGGPLTGDGCHILAIDDPVKDYAEAMSPTKRESVWDWYGSTAYTRVAPGGGVIVMLTRWHEDDLAGRLLREEGRVEDGGTWRVLSYPAIAEEDEEHRAEGEALHPARWPLGSLRDKERTLGPMKFAALFQQRPRPAGGALFRLDYFEKRYQCSPLAQARDCDEVWMTIDANRKAKPGADFTSMQVWGRKGPDRFLLGRRAGRWDYPALEQAFREFYAEWQWCLNGVLVEDMANGTALLGQMRREIPRMMAFQPTGKGDKVVRANTALAVAAAGNAVLPDVVVNHETAAWVRQWLEQVVSFPAGANDDDVDAWSQIEHHWLEQEQGGSMADIAKSFGFM